jgi:phage-related protein
MAGAKRLTAAFWRAENGEEPVRAWLRSLPVQDRKLIGADIMAVEFGWPLGLPLCRPLGAGLWEVRTDLPHGRTARVLFCLREGTMVLLHGFEKKSRKAPQHAIELATRRMKGLER